MTQHLGTPIPSPALMEKISAKFGRAMDSFGSRFRAARQNR